MKLARSQDIRVSALSKLRNRTHEQLQNEVDQWRERIFRSMDADLESIVDQIHAEHEVAVLNEDLGVA